MPLSIPVGSTVRCTETGKSFVVTTDGLTFNYARDSRGNILSDEGVDIRERRELQNRSAPFSCYLASDGKHVTGWKGNILGTVIAHWTAHSGFCQSLTHVRVRDVHGGLWHGKGLGKGMHLRLRASKG